MLSNGFKVTTSLLQHIHKMRLATLYCFLFVVRAGSASEVDDETRYAQEVGDSKEANVTDEGGWKQWGAWGPCGEVFEFFKIRSRECEAQKCSKGYSKEALKCGDFGGWSEWSDWGACNLDRPGYKLRKRICDQGRCEGASKQIKGCSGLGVWSKWGPWGGCDDGLSTSHRVCLPLGGSCAPGNNQRIKKCSEDESDEVVDVFEDEKLGSNAGREVVEKIQLANGGNGGSGGSGGSGDGGGIGGDGGDGGDGGVIVFCGQGHPHMLNVHEKPLRGDRRPRRFRNFLRS